MSFVHIKLIFLILQKEKDEPFQSNFYLGAGERGKELTFAQAYAGI